MRYGLLSAASISLLLYMVYKIDLQRLIIDQISWWYMLPVALLTLLSYGARSWFFSNALPARNVPAQGQFLLTGVYSWFAIVFPFGVGHLSYPYLLKRRYGVSAADGAAALIGYNILRVIALCAIFFASLPFLPITGEERMQTLIHWIAALCLGGCVLAALLVSLKGRRLPGRLGDFAQRVVDGLSTVFVSPRVVPLLAAALTAEALNLSVYWCAFQMTGVPVGPAGTALVFGIANLSVLLPVHGVGSLGTFEAVVSFGLIAIGLDPSDAVQISILVHLVQLGTRSIIGAVCYLLLRPMR